MGFESFLPISFVSFDTETTGVTQSDCVIELAGVKVIDGVIVAQFSSFVKPTAPISPRATAVHHITQDMVADAPPLCDVVKAFLLFVENLPLIAHNASFDVRFLESEACNQNQSLMQRTFDSVPVARYFLPQLAHHRLCDLAEHFGIVQTEAHRAVDDATVLANVWLELARQPMPTAQPKATMFRPKAKPRKRYEAFSPKELSQPSHDLDTAHPLYGKSIVFTGSLSLDRKRAAQMAADVGACVKSGVSRKTDYLVVGTQDTTLVGANGLSSKEENAMALNAAGKANIQIIDECTYVKLLTKEGVLC